MPGINSSEAIFNPPVQPFNHPVALGMVGCSGGVSAPQELGEGGEDAAEDG